MLCIIASIIPVWWPGLKNSPTVTYSCRKRRLKWVPSTSGYSWAILSPGVINTETWSSRLGLGAGLTIQPCEKVIVTKPQQGRPGPDLGCRTIWWWWWWWVQHYTTGRENNCEFTGWSPHGCLKSSNSQGCCKCLLHVLIIWQWQIIALICIVSAAG
jgi:hypothetical protein